MSDYDVLYGVVLRLPGGNGGPIIKNIDEITERFGNAIKKEFEEKILEFFDGHADMVEFNVDQDIVKVRGRYEKTIPPKLIMEFCDKFGYYMPTLKNDWIGTSMFSHVHYRFSKKDCRISKEV